MTNPMLTSPTVNATVYLTLRQDWRSRSKMSAVKVTNKQPTVYEGGDVVVKLNISLPEKAFKVIDGGIIIVDPEGLDRIVAVTPTAITLDDQ